jgi:hypothetical protein
VGRRGIKEFRAPEALALIAADRAHQPLVCPSCGTRTIQRVPRRRPPRPGDVFAAAERISLTCAACSRHASYISRGTEPPRDATMDPLEPAQRVNASTRGDRGSRGDQRGR